MPDLNQIAVHFSPELILTVGILALLLYDLAIGGRARAQAGLAITILVLATAATLWLAALNTEAMIFEARSALDPSQVVRGGSFVSDNFTHFFRLAGLLTAILVALSGRQFMGARTPFKGEFYAMVLSAALAMNLMAGANDLIIVVLAIEFLSITSYILTAYLRGDPLSIEGGLKYFLYGAATSAVMLFGMTLIFGATGTTVLSAPEGLPSIAAVSSDSARMMVSGLADLFLPALVMVMAGIGFKIALVPFHQWSPDAYEGAPTPITAFLSVGPKLAGFAVLLRVLIAGFGASTQLSSGLAMLAALAALTMIVGNVAALTQTNVKRIMAYSSIAQAGYMLVAVVSFGAVGLLDLTALGALLFFLLAYLFTNLGAFAVIIGVDQDRGSSELEAFGGLIRRSPLAAVALAIFFLSLIGIPPLSGFMGKFAVFGSALVSGQVGLALIGVLTGVISVGYYFRVLREVFFGQAPEGAGSLRFGAPLRFVLVVCLAATFLIGLFPTPFIQMANDAAAAITPALEMAAEHP